MPMPATALAMAQVGVALSVPAAGDPAPSREAEPRKSAKGEDASAAPQASADPAVVVPTPVVPLPPAVIADTATAAPDISASAEAAPARHAHVAAALAADAAADPSTAAPETHLSAPLFTQTLEGATARHAALPYAPAEPAVTVREGRFGTDIGVTIARALDAGNGADGQAKGDLLIRLDPRHMGRVDVRLSFDHDGVMRAVVSADNPAALELLRRESTDLGRALTDAGVRADEQSLRFDGGSGGNGAGNGGQSRPGASTGTSPANDAPGGDEIPIRRSLKGSGHVDLMA
jgi:flagellar hook-length control protein FliK